MRKLWDEALTKDRMPGGLPPKTDRVYRWRTSDGYQNFLRKLKWSWMPNTLGVGLRVTIFVMIGIVFALAAGRLDLFVADRLVARCGSGGRSFTEWGMVDKPFATSEQCFATGLKVEEDQKYRITFAVTDQWLDWRIVTDPTGFGSDRMPWYAAPTAMLRRSTAEPWFRPVLKIEREGWINRVQTLDVRATSATDTIYYADFRAGARGEVVLYVNDVLVPYLPRGDFLYKNNLGTADVCIERVFGELTAPELSKCMAAFSKVTRVGQTIGSGQPR